MSSEGVTTEYEAMVEHIVNESEFDDAFDAALWKDDVERILTAAHVPELLADRDRLRAYEPCDPCKADDHANCTGDCSSMCCALADLESRNAALERVAEAARNALPAVLFHTHDLLVEFPKVKRVGGCGHHAHDGFPRHYHYASGARIDWRDDDDIDHSTGFVNGTDATVMAERLLALNVALAALDTEAGSS